MKNANSYTLGFTETDKTKLPLVGGKGANLGELCTIGGLLVPQGFCITTEAFKRILDEAQPVNELLQQLSLLKAGDRNKISELSSRIREAIEAVVIPADISEEIVHRLFTLGDENAYAVRSSATAEDLPTASFAGQQDTYLNVIGKQAVLQHISKCWASLFTGRAVTYRIQNGFPHSKVYLSVIVQKMIFPQAAGIMFTADPINGNRKVTSIDASFGLGEALVAGLVNADNYKAREGVITGKNIPAKKVAVQPVENGGTEETVIDDALQNIQTLTDEQIVQLEGIGRKIEAHFGRPQDIEWCLADDEFYIVQSRPITTLFPIPKIGDNEKHVYVSVGHQQMMTDAMRPLGLSIWQLRAARPMYIAANRLFVDVAPHFANAAGRNALIDTLGKSDPLIKDALVNLLDRGDFIPPLMEAGSEGGNNIPLPGDFKAQTEDDPKIVTDLIKRKEAEIEATRKNIQTKTGVELFDFIVADINESKKNFAENMAVIMAAINASAWINEKMEEWLGEKNVADTLTQSVHNNITSDMGRALMDVADIIRPYHAVVDYLQHTKDDNFLDELGILHGGEQSRNAISTFLDKYGMRCTGEIDTANTRWAEKPLTLVPMILNNIKNFAPGASRQKFQQGLQQAMQKQEELLHRLQQLPGGSQKAAETKKAINMLRNFIGYREYPKYSMIALFAIYKQALMKEAEQLAQANIINTKEDVYYLTFEEFREAVRTQTVDKQLITERKEAHKHFEKLTPPRVFTSDGEIITGAYKRSNLPANAIVGLAVSAGVVEGTARVVLRMEDANLGNDDILVTPFTDPSWTPLFVAIKGLVTEVGGMMTHGAVIAREYGLPAVVGVENATTLIKDGQRIKVYGTEGWVEVL